MAKVYVLMGVTTSPVAFNVPYPVAVYRTLKDAKLAASERDRRSTSRRYYVRSADDHQQNAAQGGGENNG